MSIAAKQPKICGQIRHDAVWCFFRTDSRQSETVYEIADQEIDRHSQGNPAWSCDRELARRVRCLVQPNLGGLGNIDTSLVDQAIPPWIAHRRPRLCASSLARQARKSPFELSGPVKGFRVS